MEPVSEFYADGPFDSSYRSLVPMEASGVNNTGGLTSTSGKFDADCYAGMNGCDVVFPENFASISCSMGVFPADDSSVGGFAVDWSAEEQHRLEEGLINFAAETSIMTYIKIAATLPKKTVRDVALRCKWMLVMLLQDKLAASSLKMKLPFTMPQNIVAVPLMVQALDSSNCLLPDVLAVESRVRHVLEKNCQLFSQIRTNLSEFKLQENRDLFVCTRDNITAILNEFAPVP